MHIGAILVVIGLILVVVDLFVARGPRTAGAPARVTYSLLHVGVILIGIGVLLGGALNAATLH
jgi:hypothetical protein